jgi:nucleotide-binding universal stress UspA family protein
MFENYGTILHATDFSDASAAALEFASRLARDHQCKLAILHVMTPAFVAYSQKIRIFRRAAVERIERLAVPAGISSERLIVRGDPVAEILRTAAEISAGVIVIGKRTCGLKRLFDNSVGEQIVRRADRPVLTVSASPPLPDTDPTGKPDFIETRAGSSERSDQLARVISLRTRRKSWSSSLRMRSAADLSGARSIAEG